MFQNKKVLVTGGAGFVGTNLLNRLLGLGAVLRASFHIKKPVVDDERIEYVQADLTDKEACQKLTEGIDYVFMCAANTSGAAVMERTPLVHVTPNVIMNTLMLDAAYQTKVKKFLFISSSTVYATCDHPVKESEAEGAQLFEKYFCVGWMKRFSELLCQMYSQKIKTPMPTVVIRPGNLYGPFDDFAWETSHVLAALMRKAVEGHQPLEVWGDGSEIKDFIYIDDFIEGMLLAMEKIETFDPVNIASGRPVSIKQALEAILEAADFSQAEVTYNTFKPTMIPKRLIDISKAKELFGFEAKTCFSEGIKKTVDWYQAESLNNVKKAVS